MRIYCLLLLLLSIVVGNAQDPRLTSNDWVLTSLFINGVHTPVGNINYLTYDVELEFIDSGTDYSFTTSVCPNQEDIVGSFAYPNPTATPIPITFTFGTQTLGSCCDPYLNGVNNPDQDCLDLSGYSNAYANFFLSDVPPVVFNYEIGNLGNSTFLVIIKQNGDRAEYTSATASIEDYNHLDIHFTQDQVSNRIQLAGDDVHRIQLINVFDLSGKHIEQLDIEKDSWDTSQFSSGLYLLQLKLEHRVTTLKFLKQ